MNYPFNVVAPSMMSRGILQYFIQDPDGYYIEICDCQRLAPYVFANGLPPADEDRIEEYCEDGLPWAALTACSHFVMKARRSAVVAAAMGNTTAGDDIAKQLG